VRFLNHGGTPDLNNLVGTISDINNITNQITITYDTSISVAGDGGNLTLENSFVLAKGKIQ
jgi:hypothetical protein